MIAYAQRMPVATTKHIKRAATIQVHVSLLDQLFNSIDPSPFHSRDIDPAAEQYILDSGRELPREGPLALMIHLDQPPQLDEKTAQVESAIHTHFAARAASQRAALKDLFKRGRISLLIGLTCLAGAIAAVEYTKSWLPEGGMADLLREGFLIGGWVAMWRPMELFLYDWWPVKAHIRLLDRLATMPVRVVHRHAKAVSPP